MVDNNGTTKEVEFPLAGFTGGKCGRVTDISKRVLSNRDACLLLLAANGPICSSTLLKALLRAWRPLEGVTYQYRRGDKDLISRSGRFELNFGYLFNGYYGHTCGNIDGRPYTPYCHSAPRSKAAYFWSTKRNEYKISNAGYKRLAWLLQQLKDHNCVPESLKDFVNPLWSAEVQ